MATPACECGFKLRGQCQTSIEQLLVKFILWLLSALVPKHLSKQIQSWQIAALWNAKGWGAESFTYLGKVQGEMVILLGSIYPQSKQMPSLVRDGFKETEKIWHSKERRPVKGDHVVKVAALQSQIVQLFYPQENETTCYIKFCISETGLTRGLSLSQNKWRILHSATFENWPKRWKSNDYDTK